MTEPAGKIREKIRALLAVAERSTNPAEAEAFLAKAGELMAIHGVERADLLAADPTSDTTTNTKIEVPGPHAGHKTKFLGALVHVLGGQAVRWSNETGGYTVHVFAYGADLERITMLWRVLAVQVMRGMAARAPHGQDTAIWRRSWLAGFRDRVIARLQVAEDHAQQEAAARPDGVGNRYALALRDKNAIVRREYTAAYPNAKSARASRARLTAAGYQAGVRAGDRADLGARRLGGNGAARASITN